MANVASPPNRYPLTVETVVVGAGAAGLVAALAANEAGQDVLVVERDSVPSGSTALSAGLIPAAGTRFQKSAGIEDDPATFAADIREKAGGENDPARVLRLAESAAETVEWLASAHGLEFSLVGDFDYPGHSRRRMHGLPERSGRELVDRLRAAAEAAGIDILCDARVETLHAEGRRIAGLSLARPGGEREDVGCGRLILACGGFGADRARVARHMPGIAGAVWFGHDGHAGDALDWGEALGAATDHLGAYQGHGNVAHPHGILITWAVMTEGGVQINSEGRRFWDESRGYSEAAQVVLAQPGGTAVALFDARIAKVARQFADFRAAESQGAIATADSLEDIAARFGLPGDRLLETVAGLPTDGIDGFGRRFSPPPLAPPYCASRVTGALFHTQGGLKIDDFARVLGHGEVPFPNLYAAGGAAAGVSGSGDAGYLSGNGLLAATVLGRIAGRGFGPIG